MEQINIYTKKEITLLKEYLAKKNIFIRSKKIVTNLVFENDGFAHEKQMYSIYEIVWKPGQRFKVLYSPSPEDLIGAGIITAEEYRRSCL